MPLLDLRTDLKSLKYGSDRFGGGDSGQPFIQNDINNPAIAVNNIDDGFIRGGFTGAFKSSVTDFKRITKFLKNSPQGPLFIARQIGLQLSNPRVERRSGPYSNALEGLLQPTRLYNAGINTLAQVPVNAFGIHFKRHGLQPTIDERTMYESVVRSNAGLNNNNVNTALKENRLLVLFNRLDLGENVRGSTIPLSPAALRQQNRQSNIAERRRIRDVNRINKKEAELAKASVLSQYRNQLLDDPQTRTLTDKDIEDLISITKSEPLSNYGYIAQKFKRVKLDKKQLKKSRDIFYLDDYIGGPGSTYGIGNTLIRRYSFTEDLSKIEASYLLSKDLAGKTRNDSGDIEVVKISNTTDFALSYGLPNDPDLDSTFLEYTASNADRGFSNKIRHRGQQKFYPYSTLGVSKFYFPSGSDPVNAEGYTTSSKSFLRPENAFNLTDTQLSNAEFQLNPGGGGSTRISTEDNPLEISDVTIVSSNNKKNALYNAYQRYTQIIESRQLREELSLVSGSNTYYNETGIYGDSYTEGSFKSSINQNILPTSDHSPSYQNGFKERVNFKGFTWRTISREARVGSGRKDILNLTPIFNANRYFGNDTVDINGIKYNVRDLVKFKIQGVFTDNPSESNHIVFRAYLTSLSDDVNGEWTDIKYAGRGDKFYVYNGFTRKISVSFKVAALSVEEMRLIYLRLNALMGQVMPDYRGTLMRGPLTRLTIGNWVDAQLGKIDSISFKVPDDSPWEIALDEPENGIKELILPHVVEVTLSFTPIGAETKGRNRLAQRDYYETSHIAQNNTGADAAFLQYISRQTPAEARRGIINALANALGRRAF